MGSHILQQQPVVTWESAYYTERFCSQLPDINNTPLALNTLSKTVVEFNRRKPIHRLLRNSLQRGQPIDQFLICIRLSNQMISGISMHDCLGNASTDYCRMTVVKHPENFYNSGVPQSEAPSFCGSDPGLIGRKTPPALQASHTPPPAS